MKEPIIGIFSNIPNAKYHAESPPYSSSLVKEMKVPAKAHYKLHNPQEYVDAFRIGSAVHKYQLERADFESEFLTGISSSRRSKADKEEWSQWFWAHGADGDHITSHKAAEWNDLFEKATGKHMVTPEEIEMFAAMSESMMANQNARMLLENGIPEQSIYWVDDETGLSLRCRPDYLNRFCSDLKTCQNASSFVTARNILDRQYHVSEAMYTDGIFQITGEHKPFLYVFVEKTPPYLCAVYGLDDDAKELGWVTYREYLLRLAKCLESDKWPGLNDELELSLPTYAFKG